MADLKVNSISNATDNGAPDFPNNITITGVTDGSNAAAGKVGEYIETSSSFATVGGTTGQRVDLLQITLTAGEWEIYYTVAAGDSTNSTTAAQYLLSNTAGDTAVGTSYESGTIVDDIAPTASYNRTVNIKVRVNFTGADQTYYGKTRMFWSGTAPVVGGTLSARRIG